MMAMCVSFQEPTYSGEDAGKTEVVYSVQAKEMK